MHVSGKFAVGSMRKLIAQYPTDLLVKQIAEDCRKIIGSTEIEDDRRVNVFFTKFELHHLEELTRGTEYHNGFQALLDLAHAKEVVEGLEL